ncbi:MAG: hypothetical protein K2W99_06930 [Chthoniobacterales bacterium]|nr:hypothetical protein [Chthoniobacterales bacterium]
MFKTVKKLTPLPEALSELEPLLASLQKTMNDLLKPSYLYIGRYGHLKGNSFHFHLIPVYAWGVEDFMKDKRYQTLKQFCYRHDGIFSTREFDAGDIQLYIWREFCESKTPPTIVGPSVKEAIELLRMVLSDRSLKMMDQSVAHLLKGKSSPPIDLSPS